jgi:hypothetical protein
MSTINPVKPCNYLHIRAGWDLEVLVPANAKTLEAFNLLFGPDTLYVSRSYDDGGSFYEPKSKFEDAVTCQIMDYRAINIRPRMVKDEEPVETEVPLANV